MFVSISPAPSRAPVSDTSKTTKRPGADRARGPHKDEDKLLMSVSSDDEDRKRRRPPMKTLVLGPIPNASGFRRWQFVFYIKICLASRHDSDSIMAWIQHVEKPGVNFVDLEVSDKRWGDLDVAFAEAMLKVVNNSLLKEILHYQDTQAKEGKLMHGRAALWYVYRQYALSAAATPALDLQTLMHLKFSGDFESFIHPWDASLLAISRVPEQDFLYSLLEPKLLECKKLGPAFAYLD